MSLVVELERKLQLGKHGRKARSAGDGEGVVSPPRTNVLSDRNATYAVVAAKSSRNEAGKYMLWVAFSDGTLGRWIESTVEASGFTELSRFSGHKGPLLCLDVAPPFTAVLPTRLQRIQGLVVTGSVDRTAMVWDPEAKFNDEACVQTFWDLPGVVSSLLIVREQYAPGHVFVGTNQGKVLWYRADEMRQGLQYNRYTRMGVVDAGGWVHCMVYEDQGTSEQAVRRLWVGTGAGVLKFLRLKKLIRGHLTLEKEQQLELVFQVTDKMDKASRSITHLLWDDENNLIHILCNTCEHIVVNTTTLGLAHRWTNEEGVRYTSITVDELRGNVYLTDAFGYLEVWDHKNHRMYRNRISNSSGEMTATQDEDIVVAFVEAGADDSLVLSTFKPRCLEIYRARHSGKDTCLAEHYAKVLSIHLIDTFVDYLGTLNLDDIRRKDKEDRIAAEEGAEDPGGISQELHPSSHSDDYIYDDDDDDDENGEEESDDDALVELHSGRARASSQGGSGNRGQAKEGGLKGVGAGAGILMVTSSSDNLVKNWDMSLLLGNSMQRSDRVVIEEERSEMTACTLCRFSHGVEQSIRYAHLTGHENGTLRLWYLERELLVSLKVHSNSISCIASMNLKGNTYFAATASFDGTVNIVNVLVDTKNKPHVTYRFKASSEELYCVVHMPDPDPNDGETGGRVFCSGADGLIRGYTDLGVPIHKCTFEGHNADVLCLAVTHDTLASGGIDGEILVWDATVRGDTCEPIMRLKGHAGAVTGLEVFLESSKVLLLSCSLDCSVVVWDLRGGVPVYSFALPDPCTCIRYFSKDSSVLVGTETGKIFHRVVDVGVQRERLVVEAERSARIRRLPSKSSTLSLIFGRQSSISPSPLKERQRSVSPMMTNGMGFAAPADEPELDDEVDAIFDPHRDPELSDLTYEIKPPRFQGSVRSIHGLEPTWTVAVSKRKNVRSIGRVSAPPVLPVDNKNYRKVSLKQIEETNMARRLTTYKGKDAAVMDELKGEASIVGLNTKRFQL